MEKKFKHEVYTPTTMIIKKFGYEYLLVEVTNRKLLGISDPCAFGMKGWALKSYRKIDK